MSTNQIIDTKFFTSEKISYNQSQGWYDFFTGEEKLNFPAIVLNRQQNASRGCKMVSRFAELDWSVSDFIKENENENTMRKTKQNVALLQEFLAGKVKVQSDPSRIIRLPSAAAVKAGKQCLFSGTVIRGGQILNQLPTLSSEIGCSPSKR